MSKKSTIVLELCILAIGLDQQASAVVTLCTDFVQFNWFCRSRKLKRVEH
jgi:hypothetical protein